MTLPPGRHRNLGEVVALRHQPYAAKFLMSGAAAGRVFVFDSLVRLDPDQYHGNVLSATISDEWSRELRPSIAREARRRRTRTPRIRNLGE